MRKSVEFKPGDIYINMQDFYMERLKALKHLNK